MEELPNNHQPSTSMRSSSQSSALTSKRTRVVISQSKRGCVTCKTRRVKCDEQKPLCRRCVQAGRLCGGYSPQTKSSATLQPALKVGVSADSNTERLSHLAAHVLSLDTNGHPLHEDGVWGRVFLQLSNQVECVKAAAAAFGAAYESLLTANEAAVISPSSAWRYYGSALAKLQSGFNNEAVGSESLALASMILAFVEILSQHEENAHTHFLGAVQIMTETHQRRRGAPSVDMLSTINDGLITIDVAIGSYGLSQTPQVMHLESREESAEDVFRGPKLAINAAMLCLHRSYQFIESAARLRYTYPSWKEHDADMCKGQSDAVAQCGTVLDGLTALTMRLQSQYSSASAPRDSETLAEIYAMRTQLNSTIIFLLCVHSPFQTVYDKHQDQFRSIVSDAAASARLRRRTKASAFSRFSTRPGIVGPLFMVAMKCRDAPLRALATTMLKEQGREGPTDGQIMAAIGARLVALETSDSASCPDAPLAASDVLEGQRVHGYGVPPPRLDGEGRRVVDVEFSRPLVPLMEGWGRVDYTSLDNWTIWSEPVHV